MLLSVFNTYSSQENVVRELISLPAKALEAAIFLPFKKKVKRRTDWGFVCVLRKCSLSHEFFVGFPDIRTKAYCREVPREGKKLSEILFKCMRVLAVW